MQLIKFTEGMLTGVKDREQSDVVVILPKLLTKCCTPGYSTHLWNRPREICVIQHVVEDGEASEEVELISGVP